MNWFLALFATPENKVPERAPEPERQNAMRDILREQLIRHEGRRLKPYRCTAGKLTIGIGRNLDDVGITDAECLYLLENDMDTAIGDARNLFEGFESLSPVRQAVLANMAFNLGKSRLSLFTLLRRAIKERNYEEAARQMKASQWAQQVGGRARQLAELMETGT